MESTSTRKPCFLEDDNGLASIADHSFSSNHHTHLIISRSLCSPRKTNPNYYAQVSSPRSRKFFNGKFDEQPSYFLDACFLCKKPLSGNKDIFMYRGDTAFCSEECRTEQIDKDEAKENWNNISVSSVKKKSLARKKEVQSEKSSNNTSSNKASKNYPFQSGALAAA